MSRDAAPWLGWHFLPADGRLRFGDGRARDEEPPVRRCDWRGRWVLGDPRAVKGFCRCCSLKGWRVPFRRPRVGLPGGHYVRTSRDVRQGR